MARVKSSTNFRAPQWNGNGTNLPEPSAEDYRLAARMTRRHLTSPDQTSLFAALDLPRPDQPRPDPDPPAPDRPRSAHTETSPVMTTFTRSDEK